MSMKVLAFFLGIYGTLYMIRLLQQKEAQKLKRLWNMSLAHSQRAKEEAIQAANEALQSHKDYFGYSLQVLYDRLNGKIKSHAQEKKTPQYWVDLYNDEKKKYPSMTIGQFCINHRIPERTFRRYRRGR